MNIRPAILLSAVAGCLVGYLGVGRWDSLSSEAASGYDGNRQTRSGEAASPSSMPDKSRNGPAGEKRKTFASLLREAPAIAERNKPCREVERMDATQLKAAVLESFPQRGSLSTIGAEAASAVFSAAVRELCRRDGEKALEWAAAEVPAGIRADVLSEMLVQVAKDSPDLMKVWSDRCRGEYGSRWADRFELPAVTGAAGRGAEELLRVCKLLSTNLLPERADSYPEDFDFGLLVSRSVLTSNLGAPVSHWAAREKEDSWKGVKHLVESNPGKGTILVGHMFLGVAALEGEERAAGWIVEKIGELHPQLRQRALQHLNLAPIGTEATVAVVKALQNDADRVFFVSRQFDVNYQGQGLAALKTLESPQLQTDALTASAAVAGRFGPPDERTRVFFTSAMDQLHLDPQSREKIMETLERQKTKQQ